MDNLKKPNEAAPASERQDRTAQRRQVRVQQEPAAGGAQPAASRAREAMLYFKGFAEWSRIHLRR